MPIYAYKCESCGIRQDVLQKVSDPVLSICPSCGAPSFVKQVTAAGFQLKGSGWYVTDFRGGSGAKAPDDKTGSPDKPGPPDKPAAEAKPADAAAPATSPAPAEKPPTSEAA